MKGAFRQSMAWLHTWCGLVCGWLLCAIFFTGSLSVFREPISRWMEARPTLAVQADTRTGEQPATPLAHAVRYLSTHAAGARSWRIDLPAQSGDAMMLVWRNGQRNETVAINPDNGNLLQQPWGRRTEGGRHFMSFHYMLHADTTGFWIVGFVSLCALVALISGVCVHRRIFQDFFTFRRNKGQRSWLDAHNATAVLTLPFLFMIVYTGLVFFLTPYLPWPLKLLYGEQAHARFQAELSQESALPRRPSLGKTAPQHDLDMLLKQANALAGQPMARIFIEHPGDAQATVQLLGAREPDMRPGREPTLVNNIARVVFDGVTGRVLSVQQAQPARFTAGQVQETLKSLHLARFGGWPIKWFYFISGLLGTAMIAVGGILFMVKRRQKSAQEFGAGTAAFYRFVEAMNIATLAGIMLASAAYFHANRLLPAAMSGRDAWEIRAFLMAWGLSLIHALLVNHRRAWVQQFALAACLCLALPLLNFFTTGQHVIGYVFAGDGQRAGVELAAIGFGALLAYIARRLQRRWSKHP